MSAERAALSAACTARRAREGVLMRFRDAQQPTQEPATQEQATQEPAVQKQPSQEVLAVEPVRIKVKVKDGQLAVMFILARPWVRGEAIAVCGSVAELAGWNPDSVQALMTFAGCIPEYMDIGLDDLWVGFAVLPAGKNVQYKYVVLDSTNNYKFKYWLQEVNGSNNMEVKVQEGNQQEYDRCRTIVMKKRPYCYVTVLQHRTVAQAAVTGQRG